MIEGGVVCYGIGNFVYLCVVVKWDVEDGCGCDDVVLRDARRRGDGVFGGIRVVVV